MIEEELFSYLTGHAGLSALIDTRLYPVVLPVESALPAVVYHRISTPRVRSHSGPSGLASPRFQFDCWAQDYLDARRVATQLRYALDGFHGTMGSLRVDAGFVENDLDRREAETWRYRAIVDVIIWHEEATS